MLRDLNLEGQGVKSRGDWARHFGVTRAVIWTCYFVQYVH